jgi:prepilin-type N-terminal cleavage/methylation domain-containing protein
MAPRDHGFTLAELVVIVAIIGVLAAIAIPIWMNQDERAAQASLEADLVAASGMLAAARGFGYPLPAEFPAGQQTVVQGVGVLQAQQTLVVVNSPTQVCVEGTVAGTTTTLSMSSDSGLTDGPCPQAEEFGLTLEYPSTEFVTGSDMEVLSPAVFGESGDVTFSVTSGILPPGVSFDTATGDLTGPDALAWNFQAVQVSTGREHACAVTGEQQVTCWGSNQYGQLGSDSYQDSLTPVSVISQEGDGPLSNVTQVSTGAQHTCAVTSGSELYCWGSNQFGQLGLPDEYDPLFPFSISYPKLLSTGWKSVSAGEASTCAVTLDGWAYCWGSNVDGLVGSGVDAEAQDVFASPTRVAGLSGVSSVSMGFNHACAVAFGAQVWCWGNDQFDQLGNADYVIIDAGNPYSPTPVSVTRLTRGADSIDAGTYFTCVTSGGHAYCWGQNVYGQVGDGTTSGVRCRNRVFDECQPVPTRVAGVTNVVAVLAGDEFGCAQRQDGSVWCWGNNTFGQLGDGDFTASPTAVLTGVSADVGNRLGEADGFGAAVTTGDGRVLSWGDNSFGQLGDGNMDPSATPVAAVGAGPTDGFPSPITVSATDGVRSGSTTFTLTQTSPSL